MVLALQGIPFQFAVAEVRIFNVPPVINHLTNYLTLYEYKFHLGVLEYV